MTEGVILNERELLALGISRANVAALRKMQEITGSSITDPTLLAEVIAITVSTIGEMRGHVSRLKNEIEELRQMIPKARVSEKSKEIEELSARVNQRVPVMRAQDEVINRNQNISELQKQLDEIKTFIGM